MFLSTLKINGIEVTTIEIKRAIIQSISLSHTSDNVRM